MSLPDLSIDQSRPDLVIRVWAALILSNSDPLLLGMAKGWDTPEQGAATPIFLATSPKVEGKSGTWWVYEEQQAEQFERDSKTVSGLLTALEKMTLDLKKKYQIQSEL